MSLFGYETKKVLIKQYALFIFLAVIAVKLFSLPDSLNVDYGFKTSAEKNEYIEMIRPLSGKLTEENEAVIIDMKERLIEGNSLMSKIVDAYASGDLEEVDRINEQVEEYMPVLEKKDIVERIYEQYNYASADRENRAIIPVSEVGVTEKTTADYPFLLCVCFCCAFAIMVEQTSKTHIIIRTSPNGQSKTMAAKLGILFLSIAVTSTFLSLIDYIALGFQLPQEYWQYSICSLEGFGNCPTDISIIGAFVAVQLMRMLGSLFIGAAAMLTAHFSRNYAASVFPFIALPVILDYVSENDSQSYFLPTGLLKGWGYFYGEQADAYTVMFHEVPVYYICVLNVFSLLFIIAASMILVQAGRNRLGKKRGGIKRIAALGAVLSMLLLTSCTAETENVIDEYGGSISVYGYNSENSRYIFDVEYSPFVDSMGREDETGTLKITDKETGKTVDYPFDPFGEQISINSATLFATEDFLMFVCNRAVMKLDLSDFSLTTVCEEAGPKKVVFGLIFDFSGYGFKFNISGGFSDGKTVYIYDDMSAVARLEFDGSLTFLITDNTVYGLEYDGKAFYYISTDNLLHKYDLKSGENTVIYDGEADPFTLDADGDYLYFQSNGENVSIKKY